MIGLTPLPAQPKGRRVAFLDLDIQKEDEKTNRGHQWRKKSRELKKELKQIKMAAEANTNKLQRELEAGWSFLMSPRHEEMVVEFAKGESKAMMKRLVKKLGKQDAEDKTKELVLHMENLLTAAGVPHGPTEERIKTLQRKGLSLDKIMKRTHGKAVLSFLVRNSAFRFHKGEVCTPLFTDILALSDSDTEEKTKQMYRSRIQPKENFRAFQDKIDAGWARRHGTTSSSIVTDNVEEYLVLAESWSEEETTEVEEATTAPAEPN